MLFGIDTMYLFLFILVYFILFLLFHNTYKNNWWSDAILLISVVLLTTQLQANGSDWVLFFLGSVAYLFLDTLAVIKKHWRYNTKSGYVFWAGPAWGLLTLVVFRLSEAPSIWLALVLAVLVVVLLLSKLKSNLSITVFRESPWVLFSLVCLFVSPSLFLVSLAIGIVFEYLAVEVFKTWSYPKPLYGLIGIGYGTLMVYLQLVLELFAGSRSPQKIIFVVVLTAFVILHKTGVLKKWQKKGLKPK